MKSRQVIMALSRLKGRARGIAEPYQRNSRCRPQVVLLQEASEV